MKKIFTLCLIGASLIAAEQMVAQNFYGVHSPDGLSKLATINISSGIEIAGVLVTINGSQVDGCTGMARNPTTGDLYVVTKLNSTFTLATIDPLTGVCSGVAVLTEKFSGLAFDDNGVLYGITGDGSNTPETVYTINTTTGSLSLVAQPGTGFDGEALAYNSNDGLLYRYGGGAVFQSIIPTSGATTNIFLDRVVADYAHALTYRPASDDFLLAAGDSLYAVATNGILQVLAMIDITNPGGYKGLVSVDVASIEENEGETFQLYPNPANDRLFVEVDDLNTGSVVIYSIDGKVLAEYRLSGLQNGSIDISDLPSGLYTFELNKYGQVSRRSFVVSK